MTQRLFIGLSSFGFLAFSVYAFFSFSLTAPNLILSSWQPYWQFQLYMWETFFNDRQALATLFLLSSFLVFGWYLLLPVIYKFRTFTAIGILASVVALPLLFSSTALSYDVFNYMFNAKMVDVYEANPHTQVAQSFVQDDWLRFMHNVHTPAPYGTGWTTISLIPFTFGFTLLDSFLATWLSFRLFMTAGLIGYFSTLVFFARRVAKMTKAKSLLFLFLCHPLVLIETISSQHNDIFMMWPAVTSLLLVSPLVVKSFKLDTQPFSSAKRFLLITFSGVLLFISMQIKLATVVLLPLWVYLIAQVLESNTFQKLQAIKLTTFVVNVHEWILTHWAVLASIALFVPLLTERSKWFLPWYIIWSLAWIPFFPVQSMFSKIWLSFILALSISVFFRYVPFLLAGNYADPVTTQQLIITWGGAVLLTPVLYFWQGKFKQK